MFSFVKLLFSGLNLKTYALIGLAIALGVMSLLYSLEKSSHRRTTSEYALFVTKTQALGEIQQQKNKEIEARQELVNKTIVNSYENSIEQVKEYYEANPTIKYVRINSVQDASTCSGGVSETTTSTEGINAGLDGTQEATTARGGETILDSEKLSKEIVQCLELIKWAEHDH